MIDEKDLQYNLEHAVKLLAGSETNELLFNLPSQIKTISEYKNVVRERDDAVAFQPIRQPVTKAEIVEALRDDDYTRAHALLADRIEKYGVRE